MPYHLSSPGETNGSIIGLIVAVCILCVILVVLIVIWVYRRRKSNKGASSSSELQLLINANTEDDQSIRKLWEAVHSGRKQDVESLISEETTKTLVNRTPSGESTTILVEAHLRGDSEILKALSLPDLYPVADNILIKNIARNFEERVRLVFIACERGHYLGPGGLAELLIKYWLPGTIQDNHGCSLLHCVVSAKVIPSGEPLWQLTDVKNLVNDHHCNINARNFSGETILHTLVSSLEYTKEEDCYYDGKQMTVSNAWIQLAQLLLELDCNPALPDYNNKTPVMYVNHNTAMHALLSQEKYLKPPIYSSVNIKFITNAAKIGENSIVMRMMKNVMPYFGPNFCPLKQAMENNHRDTVILLQSSGLSLLSSSTINTIKNIKLPAIIHSLIRLEINNGLQEEMRKISIGNKNFHDLLSYMQYTQEKVKNGELEFIFSPKENKDYNTRNKDLLIKAASLGLTYTCKLLKLSDIFLNYSNFDLHNPVLEALKGNHFHTATVLCVDFQLYYSVDSLNSHEYKQFQSSLIDIEMSVFKIILSSEDSISESDRNEMVEYLDNVKDNGEPNTPDARLLHLITKFGLLTLLHQIQSNTDFDINSTILNHINATSLHVAVIYENINVIEYLSYMKADIQKCMLNDLNIMTLLKIINNNGSQNIIERHLDISQIIPSKLSEEDVNRIKQEIDNISLELSREGYKFQKEILIILREKLDLNPDKPLNEDNSFNKSLDMDSVSQDKIVT
ncbi:unnamed protein product [Meganyctiphanes norvegica]|uniref:Uncharacterized protein n=1 Tax=Meganyctiphanes norvegica TaxID=48144 RepID=A0AAV2RBI7_MEGNR